MASRNSLTAARLRELLHYDSETGLFTWRVPRRGRRGQIAGTATTRGYIHITVDGRAFGAHRLAVLYVTGAWPAYQVDHRDGVKWNNRWSNLRDVTSQVNNQNRRSPHGVNSSGYLGVSWDSYNKAWKAGIQADGRHIHLGHFDDPKAGHEAYLRAKRELHEGCTI